ncbi:hypothetical protein M5G27_19505 [Pseudomonas shahriarae]|jgi:uncharacterized protein VirK/YbjX|uniref:Uncharacterized protein n=1 Tax=Pseudomonas shahriarae TaxID=2745512 RepID=A0A9X4C3N8_9PSED|nr:MULTISPECIES: hypothetical protein [Pseudomonas]MDD1009669.1 hypothetical protein [Pseudomonas shahriarae]
MAKQVLEHSVLDLEPRAGVFMFGPYEEQLPVKSGRPTTHSSLALNPIRTVRFYRSYTEGCVMYEDRKANALETWERLLNHSEIRTSAPEQYDELLRLAEEYCEEGFITREERRAMIEKATANYRRAVEGIGQGT